MGRSDRYWHLAKKLGDDEIIMRWAKWGAIGFGILGALSGASAGFSAAGVGGAILGFLLGGVAGALIGGLLGMAVPQVMGCLLVIGPVILVIAAVIALIHFTWGVGK